MPPALQPILLRRNNNFQPIYFSKKRLKIQYADSFKLNQIDKTIIRWYCGFTFLFGSTVEIRGSIPEIIKNKRGIYEGNLVRYFRIVFLCAENLNNPYHNFRHMCHVLWMCYLACIFYSKVLTKCQIRNLLIASLFHDFNHTGKTGPDRVNIDRALTALRKHIDAEDTVESENIEALIKISEWPHTIPTGKLTLSGQILRDADYSQALNVSWVQEVIFGLAKEQEKTPTILLIDQPVFLRSLKFHTAWAQQMFPENLVQDKIDEAKEFLNILAIKH